jgi:hypothetical protein
MNTQRSISSLGSENMLYSLPLHGAKQCSASNEHNMRV